ncbi:MAG: hypothetical protein AAFN94_10630 [Pseudomonadota bacterium]
MNARSGYSIFEVLVAFAVMSMTLAVLVPGQTDLLGRSKDATEQALAQDLALSRLETVRVLGVSASEEPYRDWRITTTIQPGPATEIVTVTVHSGAGRTLAQEARQIAVPGDG